MGLKEDVQRRREELDQHRAYTKTLTDNINWARSISGEDYRYDEAKRQGNESGRLLTEASKKDQLLQDALIPLQRLLGAKNEFETKREGDIPTLQSTLMGLGQERVKNIDVPEIRKALSAKGILFGGAEKELTANALAGVQDNVNMATSLFKQQTLDFSQQIEKSGLAIETETGRENIINSFNQGVAGMENSLMSELMRVSQPSGAEQFLQYAGQGVGLYNSFRQSGIGPSQPYEDQSNKSPYPTTQNYGFKPLRSNRFTRDEPI